MLNLFQHPIKSIRYKTLNQVQGDKIIVFQQLGRWYNFFEKRENELPRRKQRGIKEFKFCHSALDAESRK